MRMVIVIGLILLTTAPAEAHRARNRHTLPSVWDVRDSLERHPPLLTASRLPDGYRLGRCLLEVRGRTYISGRCAYWTWKGGGFQIHGPHQVFSGVDYREPIIYGYEISTDYFVQVDHELLEHGGTGPGWEATWNEFKGATHAESRLGKVAKQGACYVNRQTRICLWKR